MSTISPPPWTFNPKRGAIYDACRSRPIIYCDAWTLGSEADANGPLVAAAPDLQVSLRALLARIDTHVFHLSGYGSFKIKDILVPEITAARAALAKSEGK